ncbi:three-Cys-motif partner protein TcmP [bacterium]|nr:three-Cys-motif partner protein TcmP [bacterium]
MVGKGDNKGNLFGGDWTTHKLDVLAGYLSSYTTALKNAHFEKLYIDAFAGTGYRDARRKEPESILELPFPDLAEAETQRLLEGSARRALAAKPRFERYVFIERSPERCAQLEALKSEFPSLAKDIEIRQGDANSEIRTLCSRDWRSRRAVLFLDPYGMQVEWATIEAVARTQAIDLWVLFPLGMGVNRLLKKSGDIPEGWRRRLDLLLGTRDWHDEFYRVDVTPTLFGGDEERVVKASMETIGKYFNKRLESVFVGVAPTPGVLRNSKQNPLYLLCFAVGNARGRDIALRIANHLLKEVS